MKDLSVWRGISCSRISSHLRVMRLYPFSKFIFQSWEIIPQTDLILLIGPKVKIQLTSSTQKPRQKTKNKSKQKTKNNKIPPKTALEEHDIIDILVKHNLTREIHASASEKYIPACET